MSYTFTFDLMFGSRLRVPNWEVSTDIEAFYAQKGFPQQVLTTYTSKSFTEM
jgi:hypothetical protein